MTNFVDCTFAFFFAKEYVIGTLQQTYLTVYYKTFKENVFYSSFVKQMSYLKIFEKEYNLSLLLPDTCSKLGVGRVSRGRDRVRDRMAGGCKRNVSVVHHSGENFS